MLEHAVERGGAELDAFTRGGVSPLRGPPAADREHGHAGLGDLVQAARQLLGGRGLLRRGSAHHHLASIARPVRPAMCRRLRSGSGKILPGFMIPCASNAFFTSLIASRSSAV